MSVENIVLYLILGALFLGFVYSVYRLHQNKNNDFNILDVLMENGRVSRLGVAFTITLVVTSWIVLKLAIDGKMTEGYLGTYGGMWVAPIIAKLFAPSKDGNAP